MLRIRALAATLTRYGYFRITYCFARKDGLCITNGTPGSTDLMDSVSDALFDGRRLRALTVVDAYTREVLTIDFD